MKYTIELTEKQANQLNDIMIGINASWGYASAPKLKMVIPLPMKESPAYQKGYEDGAKNQDEVQYKKGYNKGLEDLVHAMKVYFPLNSKERLDYFGRDTHVDAYAMENPKDLITKAKAYEEKKKAENTIECGDEVKIANGTTGIVIVIKNNAYEILFSDGKYRAILENDLKKTGRNFKEDVLQLFKKLKGEEE